MQRTLIALGLAASVAGPQAAAAAETHASISMTRLARADVTAFSSSLKSACAASSLPASATSIAPPEIPEIVDQMRPGYHGILGSSSVKVVLSETGSVQSVALLESADNRMLDLAALAVVRGAKYRPEMQDCRPVAGASRITVDFVKD